MFVYNKSYHKKQHATSKITEVPKQKRRLGTGSNEITGWGDGLQLVCGRPSLALSSALVTQTFSSFFVCVEDFKIISALS